MQKFSYKDAILNKIPKPVIVEVQKPVIVEVQKPVIVEVQKPVIVEVSKHVKVEVPKHVKVEVPKPFKVETVKQMIIKKDEQTENVVKEVVQNNVVQVKKKVNEIFVKKDSIPPKEDIMRLCSHGMYMKIKNVHFSHFTNENVKFYIHYMHNKINEIKGWKKEEKNNNESSKIRFKNRIDNIYKTINLIKSKHLEHLSNIIMDDEKWVKVGKN